MKLRWLIPLLFVIPAFAAGGTCPSGANYINSANPTGSLVTLSTLGVTSCYFVAAAGSDTNAGTTEGAPFAHVKGMQVCTSNCNSASTSAGIGWILKGGDSWTAANFPFQFPGSGNSSNPVYVGIDSAWFTGGSWSRPIFDCQATQCGSSSQVQISGGSYVILDDIESTGVKSNTSEQKEFENLSGANNILERLYCHGWSHGTFTDDGNDTCFSDNASTNSTWMFNVCDGSDTSKDMKNCMRVGGLVAAYNISNYTYEGLHGHVNDVHGNNFGNFILDNHNGPGDHANGIVNNLYSGTTGLIYNNVLHDDTLASGMEDFWICGAGTGTCASDTIWFFGNVTFNVGRGVDVGDHPPAGVGTFNMFNNTIGDNSSYCVGNGETPPRSTVNYENLHCIIPSGSYCVATGVTCNNGGTNLQQTATQADANITPHFDQYTLSQTYAYSPVLSSNSTVAAGTSLSGDCTGVVGPLCNDTTYATYNATNHTVILRSTVARPGTWDIGSYQFSSSGPIFSYSPNPVAFGSVNVGSSGGPTTVTITNTGSSGLVLGTLSSNNARFVKSSDTCSGQTVTASGGTCTFALTFSPLAAGAQTATITVPDNAGNPDTISATGTGVAVGPSVQLTCPSTCTSITFGSQIINTTSTGTVVTLTNSGNATLNITSIALTTGTQFAKSSTCGSTLGAGLNCTVTLTFTPTSKGAKSDSLVFTTNAASSPDSIALSGTGVRLKHVQNACSTAGSGTGASNSFSVTCAPNASGDAITLGALCHDSSNATITNITVAASGYSIYSITPVTATGLGGAGRIFGTLALNTSPATFTFTFTGAGNCSTFGGYLTDEWVGNDTTGGATTFNASGSNGGSTGGCNQTAANVTPATNDEAVWMACFDASTAVTTPWSPGSADAVGNTAEYQILSGQLGVPFTPAYTTSGFYVVMGTAINPTGATLLSPPIGSAQGMMLAEAK